ncbi:Guanine nucleotide-binding protein, beta subunit [Parasponia andersonii]|uniref:Guanine nucleotide-binding protein, beta subunit n=1 Tax=Parasponia andersonii TaxID=3476 RepID=A0A2P5C9X5_PARAD|nr:Guanine nucleotide-binding protein, beta subunit [Parasponia andersonii]
MSISSDDDDDFPMSTVDEERAQERDYYEKIEREFVEWENSTPFQLRNLSFNSHNEWILATGSTEGTVDIFDLRTKLQKLLTLSNHDERDVTHVEWDPIHENLLASASCDRKVIIWDLNSRNVLD